MKIFEHPCFLPGNATDLETLFGYIKSGFFKVSLVQIGGKIRELKDFEGFEKDFDSYETNYELFFIQGRDGIFYMINKHFHYDMIPFLAASIMLYTDDDGVEEENEFE